MNESIPSLTHQIINRLANRISDLENEISKLDCKYKELLKFVKKLADEDIYEKFENENEISWEAFELLQKIGEIND